jgi:hypothetical protein
MIEQRVRAQIAAALQNVCAQSEINQQRRRVAETSVKNGFAIHQRRQGV